MAPVVHGHTKRLPGGGRVNSPEYRAWTAMKNRCLNPNQERFKDYGERGISVCDRWLHGEDGKTGFECFLADMGPRPSEDHTVDRRDNDLGYSPNNCRWATRAEQARNTRSNVFYDVGTGPHLLDDLANFYGQVSPATARMRVHRGWIVDDAVLTPKGTRPIDEKVPF